MFENYPIGQYPFPWGGTSPVPNWQFQAQQDQQQIHGIKFVNGIEEAKNCTIPYGTKTLLMDKEKDRFYVKETDASGVSTVSEFEFKKVEAKPPKEYITKQEFDQLSSQLKEQYESTIQRIERLLQSPEVRLGVNASNIPTVTNVPLTGVYQNDYTGASQTSSGTDYPRPRDFTAGI